MPKTKGLLNKYFRLFLWVIFFAVIVYLILRDIGVFGNVLKVIINSVMIIIVLSFKVFTISYALHLKPY